MFKYNRNNYNIALTSVDSIINITHKIASYNYPSRGYLNKGNLLKQGKKLQEALKHYIIAKEHAVKNKNLHHQIAIKYNIARLKNILNKNQEALIDHKENLKFIKKINLKKNMNPFTSQHILAYRTRTTGCALQIQQQNTSTKE